MAEFKQLRIGILQQLNGGFRAHIAVVNKRCIPADHRKIIGVVRNARLQNLVTLTVGQRARLPADNLCNLCPVRGDQLCGGRRSGHLRHVKNEVILTQPVGIGLHQGRPGPLQLLVRNA